MTDEIKVYVKINGELTAWFVGVTCPYAARKRVIEHLQEKQLVHGAVLAVVK